MPYEFRDLLRLLDRFIGHYPIYLYLIDASNTVIWFNQFLAVRSPELRKGQQLLCTKSLWECDERCRNCESESIALTPHIHKHLVSKEFSAEEGVRFIEFFSLPVLDDGKAVNAILRLGVDVTDNEQLQEKLREKEKVFKTIINTSTDAVIYLDHDYRIQSWNRGAQEIFGYSPEEIIGRPVLQLIPKELEDMGEQEYIRKELENHGTMKKYETQRLHRDGHAIYVDVSSTLIFNEVGEPVGVAEIIKDIDSRKDLEFELLRTILELSKLNELNEILHSTYQEKEILRIILIAITAGEGLRFNRAFLLMVNRETSRLEGFLAIGPSDEEEANRIWSELNRDYHYLRDIVKIYKIDLEGADKTVNEIVHRIRVPLADESNILIQSFTKKRVYQVQNGELTTLGNGNFECDGVNLFELLKSDSFVVAPLFSKQESLGLIIADNCINKREITTEDIEGLKLFANQASSAIENARLYRTLEHRIQDVQTAYRQLEENQEQLLRVERLAAIGEMSAKIAHEIRNPLVSIGGFARLIEKRIPADSPERKYAGIISEQVSNLEAILNNILNTANPPTPQKDEVDISLVIQQVLSMLESAFERRKIVLVANLQEGRALVAGDEKMLHQAFLNLCKNAIEALDGGEGDGKIWISAKTEQENVKIIIRDNGPGIATNILTKVFQSFFTTKSSGTGLGLPIVKQIVESHAGRIEVNSKRGRGTEFVVTFPAMPIHQPLE